MLDSHGFNLWASNYDKTVGVSDDDNRYPFAGYREVMNIVYGTVMRKSPAEVLDIGIGTGTLAHKLYDGGNKITGIDFSREMLNIAQEKMPNAKLIECDFTKGFPPELRDMKYDFIISTYALHHLADEAKPLFILSALDHLADGGAMIIGDVSFPIRVDLEACKASVGDEWDDDEEYFVFTELEKALSGKCSLVYEQVSHCAGIIIVSGI